MKNTILTAQHTEDSFDDLSW